MTREFPCVSCPLGCLLRVELKDGKIERIEGNRCPRGEAYAREEITDPKRVLATSVKALGGDYPLVSARTDRPIPKRLIPEDHGDRSGASCKSPGRNRSGSRGQSCRNWGEPYRHPPRSPSV